MYSCALGFLFIFLLCFFFPFLLQFDSSVDTSRSFPSICDALRPLNTSPSYVGRSHDNPVFSDPRRLFASFPESPLGR